ncbi:10011_t:CDS:2 [Funneliformis geosporum]|nr:10011_t:CDS:2 [Funneliformis geosporum]
MHLKTKTVIPVIEENEMPSPSVVMGHIGTYSWDSKCLGHRKWTSLPSPPEPEITLVNLTNAFLATSIELNKKAKSNTSLAERNKRTKNKYITHDITE